MRAPWLAIALLVGLVACGPGAARAPHAAAGTAARSPRAVYVRDAAAVIATPAVRRRLAGLIAAGEITHVVPYGLGALVGSVEGRRALAAWLVQLRRAGAQVLAPVAGRDRLAALAVLIAEHPAVRLDGLVSELEYWNRPARAAALDELLALVAAMRAQAAAWAGAGPPPAVGVYLGYPTAAEARRLAAAVDFVFLDYSVGAPARAWGHVHARGGPLRARFGWFARAGVAVWPIFYAAGEVDMRPAMRDHGLAAIEARFLADQAADAGLGDRPPAGFVYFTFEALP